MTEDNTYSRLCAPFDTIHKDPRGLDYVTGEQVISRLNDVLGVAGWSFSIVQHGYDQEADEMWVQGRLSAWLDGREVAREQFGSQKHNRRKSDSQILDYGFDLKGAGTDCLKKCAAGLGVALYLAHKEAPGGDGGQRQERAARPVQQRPAGNASGAAPVNAGSRSAPVTPSAAPSPAPSSGPMPQAAAIPPREPATDDGALVWTCEAVVNKENNQKCRKPLVAAGGWTARELADDTQARFKKPLCAEHTKLAEAIMARQQGAAV